MNLATEARFIALIPHIPVGTDWNAPGVPELVNDLIERAVGRYHANAKCVSLTGIGNGGAGAWSLAAALPHRFAAIAVLDADSPADPKFTAAAIPDTGVYLAVGEHEKVHVAQAQRMQEALAVQAHHDFVWALVPDETRAVSEVLYQDPRFWTWLLAHRSR
jgi:predicted esterase